MAARRKLQALEYPQAEMFDPAKEGHLRSLLVWLEDTKIRFYPIAGRAALRDVAAPTWNDALTKYLQDLGCPRDCSAWRGDAAQRAQMLDWVLGYAVSCEYQDHMEAIDAASAARCAAPSPSAASAAAGLDVDSAEFRAGLQALAGKLRLPVTDDLALLLRSVEQVLTQKFTPAAVATAEAAKTEKAATFRLSDCPLGFDTGDPAVNNAAKILRLLHVNELRDMQTRVNELIVQVQALTSEPVTNARLGKVGK